MTPEEAALAIFRIIAWAEDKNINTGAGNKGAPTRDWTLATYAQCLQIVRDPGNFPIYLKSPIPA